MSEISKCVFKRGALTSPWENKSKRLFEGRSKNVCVGVCARVVCVVFSACAHISICVCVCVILLQFFLKKKVTTAFVYLNWRR